MVYVSCFYRVPHLPEDPHLDGKLFAATLKFNDDTNSLESDFQDQSTLHGFICKGSYSTGYIWSEFTLKFERMHNLTVIWPGWLFAVFLCFKVNLSWTWAYLLMDFLFVRQREDHCAKLNKAGVTIVNIVICMSRTFQPSHQLRIIAGAKHSFSLY